jgi:hypothetical protein
MMTQVKVSTLGDDTFFMSGGRKCRYPVRSLQGGQSHVGSRHVSRLRTFTAKPVPNIAAYNQLHQSRNEDWQRVKPSAEAPLPIDFLVTLPNELRSSITIAPGSNGTVNILSGGKRIGAITTRGVPVTLTPQAFGPGFARLGVIEVRAKAGSQSGIAEIIAALEGDAQSKITLIVE